jgi:two-component system response regulator FlrC
LEKRAGDIIPLAEHLIERHCQKRGHAIPKLTAAARSKLLQHSWPGNVRELENVIQRALILAESAQIDAQDLMIEQDAQFSPVLAQNQVEKSEDDSKLGSELRQQEHQIILDTLQSCKGRRKDVAERLGISPRTLRYKLARMRDVGIDLPA